MYKDPSGTTRVAVQAVWLYLAADILFGLAILAALVQPDAAYAGDAEFLLVDAAAIGLLVTTLACIVLVGRWTYRVNANAHSWSRDLTISPGWAVGWHFVPVANLFKPFQAMKEAWLASHYRGAWQDERVPPLLGWWWGLWIATDILGYLAWRADTQVDAAIPVGVLDVAQAVLNVPLCLFLIRMMKQLSAAQLTAHHDETFA